MVKSAFVFTVIVLSLISNPISLQNFNMGIFDNTDGIKPFGILANSAWAESDEDNEESDDDGNNGSEIEDEEHDENQDEENEEEIEIQVEIEDGVAKVEIKQGDDESEFELETIDEDAIIEEIVARTGLTKEQVESVIEFEIEEDETEEIEEEDIEELDDEFEDEQDEELEGDELENEETDDEFEETKIEVEIKNEVAKIKIEQNGTKSKFLLETTDEAEILAAISQKTGLTESQIQDIWELEVESEDAEDDSDESAHIKTITQKEESIQEAQSRIAELESQISELEQRIQALLEQLQSGEYFGNIENADDVSKSFSISFDGSAVSMQDESKTILSGEIFLETQVTNQNISKLRVTGGEIIVGDTYYDIMFGKARISSSGTSGVKDSMVLIGEVMDQEGNISTIRLSVDSPVPLDVDFGQEPLDVQISTPSKIAKQWSLEATGQMELL